METKVVPKFLEVAILLNLAFAPWHGCLAIFGKRTPLGQIAGVGTFGISNFGLMNILGTALQIGFFAYLVFSMRLWRKSPKWSLLFFLPLLLVIARAQIVDRHTIVLLQGFTLLGVYCFLLYWSARGLISCPLLRRFGPAAFLLSSGLSVILPFILQAEGVYIYQKVNSLGLLRYSGWSEFPSTIAFICYSSFLFCLFGLRRSRGTPVFTSVVYATGVCVFLAAMYSTTHRTSLLAVMIASGAFAFFYRRDTVRLAFGALVFAVVAIGMFKGKVGIKNDWVRSSESSLIARMSPDFRENPEVISGDGFIVNSSGRMGLWDHFFRATEGHRFWGQGTGSASRWMIQSPFAPGFGAEPHSDFLRVFFEFGVFGIVLICASFAPLWVAGVFNVKNVAITLLSLSSFLALENPIVHPNWFLIPFFWMLILEVQAYQDREKQLA